MPGCLKKSSLAAAAFALLVLLAGCAAESAQEPEDQSAGAAVSSEEESTAEAGEETIQQEATCDWDSEPATWSGDLPEGQEGELSSVLIGAWQHTHYDSGAGYEPVATADTRYIFPSEGGMLYCQHVEGITEYAEQSAQITIDGALISPPSPHPGFEAVAWDSHTMVWLNKTDGSNYVLVRR